MTNIYLKPVEKIWSFCLDLIFPESVLSKKVKNLSPEEIARIERSSPIDVHTTCLFSYQDPIAKEIIWQIKYYENESLVRTILSSMSHVIENELLLHIPQEKPIYLIAVPLSKERFHERGYNQSVLIRDILQDVISRTHKRIFCSDCIVKTKETERQTHKNRADRLHNIQDTFTIQTSDIPNDAHCIVVDDVITTGATTNAIYTLLKRSGYTYVTRFSLAH